MFIKFFNIYRFIFIFTSYLQYKITYKLFYLTGNLFYFSIEFYIGASTGD